MEQRLLYKIISWLQNWIDTIGQNAFRASKKLAFLKYSLEFGEYDSDIYVATFPKSGTTLTQMILYQMTTEGKMDFNHIYDVSPWLRNDAYKNRKLKKN